MFYRALVVTGVLLIGVLLLVIGVAVMVTDIDPLLLCFKQCRALEGWRVLVGQTIFRYVTGLGYAGLGILFLLLPRTKSSGDAGKPDR
jgi:hypothetical protein